MWKKVKSFYCAINYPATRRQKECSGIQPDRLELANRGPCRQIKRVVLSFVVARLAVCYEK